MKPTLLMRIVNRRVKRTKSLVGEGDVVDDSRMVSIEVRGLGGGGAR